MECTGEMCLIQNSSNLNYRIDVFISKFGPVKVIRLETPVPPHFQPGFQGAGFRTHMSTFPISPCVPFLVPRVSGAFPSLPSAFPLIVLQEWKREKRGEY